ncbi:ribokinase [Sinomonas sp. ASV322]|uniref:ribokinase n=1 Tax=Sinomonas sp. ASV322 TaxID=3041920 RepID=UPI0027DDF65D|nr:ribokinase [Sinomonas sp. ASV322]MDQ4504396.1 ribokinase [Sinomonas sp. ASV322]
MSPETGPEIVVIGSVNLDLVVTVPALPQPGETVLATSYDEFVGGKGSNQAIAAARLGRDVAFVGRIGDDAAGTAVRAALADEGVDVARLSPTPGEKTGRAFVQVDERAENSIIVASGANSRLSADDVDGAAPCVRDAAVVVAQLEVPLDAVRAAARLAHGTFVFNPAPARRLDPELLGLVDVLVVNQGEFEVVTGEPAAEDAASMRVAVARTDLPGSVVVTLGARGALVWHDGELHSVPAPVVEAVDTTGAGDTFVGALADALARGEALLDAARWAVCAASLSTLSLGATTAMPRSAQVAELRALSAS